MTRFDESSWDEQAGPLVRPFTLTRGRARAGRDDLTLITLVTTVSGPVEDGDDDPGRPGSGHGSGPASAETRELYPEHIDILRMCRRPQAVAEVAARLDLPVSIAKVLIGDLFDAGHVHVRPPVAMVRAPDVEILRKVRDGLRRL